MTLSDDHYGSFLLLLSAYRCLFRDSMFFSFVKRRTRNISGVAIPMERGAEQRKRMEYPLWSGSLQGNFRFVMAWRLRLWIFDMVKESSNVLVRLNIVLDLIAIPIWSMGKRFLGRRHGRCGRNRFLETLSYGVCK